VDGHPRADGNKLEAYFGLALLADSSSHFKAIPFGELLGSRWLARDSPQLSNEEDE